MESYKAAMKLGGNLLKSSKSLILKIDQKAAAWLNKANEKLEPKPEESTQA